MESSTHDVRTFVGSSSKVDLNLEIHIRSAIHWYGKQVVLVTKKVLKWQDRLKDLDLEIVAPDEVKFVDEELTDPNLLVVVDGEVPPSLFMHVGSGDVIAAHGKLSK